MNPESNKEKVYGVVAEFVSSDAALQAAGRIRAAGYTKTDGHTPIPVHGLAEALGMRGSRLAAAVLAGGTGGACAGLGLQYWVSVIAYPHIVSGKPFFSWPSFVPVIFECTILGAALTAVITLLVRSGLPQPHHPIFNMPGFEKATTDRYFLCIEAADPKYDRQQTLSFMQGLGAERVAEVLAHQDDTE